MAGMAALTLAFDVGLGARALSDPPASAGNAWSAPVVAGADALGDPGIVFSSRGAGAITWSLAGGGARVLTLPPPGGAEASASALRDIPLRSIADATADGSGRVILAGDLAASVGRATAALEVDPVGPLGSPRALNRGGGPVALTDYLTGEVALAAGAPVGRVGRVLLRLQPPQGSRLGPPVLLSALAGPVTAIAVALDYRGDALVAWQQDGQILARERRVSGTLGPLQTLGASAPAPRLSAVISDDRRGIVAWTDEIATGRATTARTCVSISGLGVRFGTASLVESWAEPSGLRLGAGAMQLKRLGDGRVVLGWTGLTAGQPVVHVAAVTLEGLRPAVTVSEAGTAAQLTDLAAGARGEALAVLTATEPGTPLDGPGEIETTVGVDEGVAGQAVFAPVEPVVAAPAANGATAAFDPIDDRPTVVWQAGGQVRYATRAEEALP